jgi:hypothetical protein
MELAEAINIFLTRGRKLGGLMDSLVLLDQMASMTSEQQAKISMERPINPVTLRGITMVCGYACNANDWLSYHNLPTTREGFTALHAEMKERKSNPVRRSLFLELYWGSGEILRLVDWNAPRKA